MPKFLQKILSLAVFLFCFLFFPAYFVHSSISLYFKWRADNLKQDRILEMNNKLEYMEKYSDNKKYFHFLLLKISEYAQKTSNPVEYLKKSIENLKKNYSDKIKFIVWDENGKPIKELSDKASFNYVLIRLYEALKEVNYAVEADPNVRISALEKVKKNINIISKFLGRLFIPEELKYPIIDGAKAGPLLTELGDEDSFAWFSIRKKISFLCFFSRSILESFSGLENIIKKFNSEESEIITGFSTTPKYELPASLFPKEYEADLSLALSTFENAGDSFFENDRCIVKMSMPQPNIRAFSFMNKKEEVWNLNYKINFWSSIVWVIILSVYCFMALWFLYKKHFFSIRWKLTALFLFAYLAPVSILAFIAKEYIENKRVALRNNIVSYLEKQLREFEADYNSLIIEYTQKLNEEVTEIAKEIGVSAIQQAEIDKLKKLYDKYNCSELFIIASDSKIIGFKVDDNRSGEKFDFMTSLGEAVLSFANCNFKGHNKADVFSNMFDPEESEIVRLSLKHLHKVKEIAAGEFSRIYYNHCFGDTVNYNNNYFFTLSWNNNVFQNIFVKKHFEDLKKISPEGNFYVKSNDGKYIYGSEEFNTVANSVTEKNYGMSETINGLIGINNKKNIYVCLNGSNLKDWTMLGFYPEDSINKEINLIIFQIVIGALLSLLLTISIGHILSLQFLSPIRNMGKAALAIGERNFAYRVPIGDKDEFGHLNEVFNRVIEGLGDFEVARIVQESLFPGNHFDVGDFKIFGRSVVMTTLGGDYYDCFKINDEYHGIIIGDVAGHGIPAGLMMAMAKSGVLTASDEVKLDPSLLTTRLHKAFFAIKNEKLKRMMTFQYFNLRVSDGHFTYTNAGHCFPIIVDSVKKTAKFIEYIATPLGIGSRCRCKNQEFVLEKDQSLVLYTDGIVEASNASGEQYGYERYKDCLPKYYDPDPEVFYYNLYNKVYKEWAPVPDDDLTLIIINRC